MMFNALLLTKNADGCTKAQLTQMDERQLPQDGDVLVKIDYSTLNYKDALAITGASPVVRQWPMVPGIDGAGTILESSHPDWKPGDAFILNGWGVGESHMGCLAQRARLKGDWLIPLPAGMTAKNVMAIGTAGYTAMLCAMALREQGVEKTHGRILVTGASGGVGSFALLILSAWGFSVTASTGKMQEKDYLLSLGADEIIDRSELSAPGKPLQKERWAGVIDSLGSHTLANALAQTNANGVVAVCGLAQGMDLPVTVAPFILRGVHLIGVNSVTVPRDRRIEAWKHLSELDLSKLDAVADEINLEQAIGKAPEILAGKIRGRLVVNLKN
ncbi:MAG: MDR family oxidoreductase [Burkholderiaceae bacterium]